MYSFAVKRIPLLVGYTLPAFNRGGKYDFLHAFTVITIPHLCADCSLGMLTCIPLCEEYLSEPLRNCGDNLQQLKNMEFRHEITIALCMRFFSLFFPLQMCLRPNLKPLSHNGTVNGG